MASDRPEEEGEEERREVEEAIEEEAEEGEEGELEIVSPELMIKHPLQVSSAKVHWN
jgi:hypothetical protein